MALQYSLAVRNDRLDRFEALVGVSAILKIRTGVQPASCAAADSGSVLATLTLPADYLAAASGGTKVKSGTWAQLVADASGLAAHWRLYQSDGTTCHAQGSVGQGSGDLSLDNTTIVAGQPVTVSAWTFTAGNA